MKSSPLTPPGPRRTAARPAIAALGLMLLAVVGNGCVNLKTREAVPGSQRKNGKSRLLTYHLADPYVQVYCYRTKLGTTDNLHVGIRSIGVPSRTRAYQLIHDGSISRDDRLRITVGPDGLLERVALRNDPKLVDTAVAVGRAVLSVAAPVPLPFKGGEDYPEFSKLVYKENLPLEKLLKKDDQDAYTPGLIIGGFANQHSKRKIRIYALPLGADKADDCLNKQLRKALCGDSCVKASEQADEQPKKSSKPSHTRNTEKVIHYRPLIPIVVTVEEVDDNPPQTILSTVSEVIFCPDPRSDHLEQLDIPAAKLAPASFVANFSGGSLFDVSVVRNSDLVALASFPSKLVEPYFSLPSSLFRFEVNHHGPGQAGTADVEEVGGDDKPGGNPRPIIKN